MAQGFAKSMLIYVIANIANAAVPFLLLPVLTRVLDPVDYGVIAMFAVTLGFFAAFTGLSVHGAVAVRYFQIEEERIPDFVTACLVVIGVSTLVVAAVVFLAAPLLTEATSLPRDWLMIGVFVAAAQIVGQIRLALWQVTGEPMRYGAFQFSQTLGNALLSLYLVLVIGMAWEARLIGQSVVIGGFGALALFWLHGAGFVVRPWDLGANVRDALRFGVPLIPHVIGGLAIVTIDRFVIASVLGLASAGIYMVAAQIAQMLGLLTTAFNKAYSPWLMRQLSKPEEMRPDAIVRGTYVYFAVVMTLALAIGAAAPIIVGVLAGEAFQEAQDAVIYAAIGYGFSGCYLIVTNYVFFERRTAILAYVTFVTGLVHVGLTYVLVRTNGIVGAGQAFAISQFLSFAGTWWLAHRVHPMPWRTAVFT